ncbi:hypothetical protein JOM49_001636 [Amycolatopsis magusensis]|uniref:Transposase n=1 Tax=Amycolatopsis magusensis TaxID=882444 RepID=A0ABS4PMG3_9PSEU|nr:hypothetical protein [Amycolatopsis magusensis]
MDGLPRDRRQTVHDRAGPPTPKRVKLKNYHAEVSRHGQHWQIHVRELDRHTQALSCQDIPMVAGAHALPVPTPGVGGLVHERTGPK